MICYSDISEHAYVADVNGFNAIMHVAAKNPWQFWSLSNKSNIQRIFKGELFIYNSPSNILQIYASSQGYFLQIWQVQTTLIK